jgi:hypothetical protein
MFRWTALIAIVLSFSGCRAMSSRAIVMERNNLPVELIDPDGMQIERGERRPVIDAVGWVIGIPGKILLWDRRNDNHNISQETEAVVADYLAMNNLPQVKVRLNQYRPIADWQRLRKNTSVAWPWRYTLGTLSIVGEAIIPGRIFGGDHYNPFSATAHIYSDIPAVGLHEAAHAKDFARREHPGTYAALYLLPGVPLWHESIATRDVFAYADYKNDGRLKREAYHILFPAYGTYLGNTIGYGLPDYATPIYYGTVIVGHAVGRIKARNDPIVTGAN